MTCKIMYVFVFGTEFEKMFFLLLQPVHKPSCAMALDAHSLHCKLSIFIFHGFYNVVIAQNLIPGSLRRPLYNLSRSTSSRCASPASADTVLFNTRFHVSCQCYAFNRSPSKIIHHRATIYFTVLIVPLTSPLLIPNDYISLLLARTVNECYDCATRSYYT